MAGESDLCHASTGVGRAQELGLPAWQMLTLPARSPWTSHKKHTQPIRSADLLFCSRRPASGLICRRVESVQVSSNRPHHARI